MQNINYRFDFFDYMVFFLLALNIMHYLRPHAAVFLRGIHKDLGGTVHVCRKLYF